MSPLTAILRMRWSSLKNRARNLKKDSLAKIFVVLFGLGNVLGLGFWVAYQSFRFIETFPAFGPALNAKVVSLLFFALLVLVVLSTMIVAYTTIFIARETEFLFQYPVRPRTVFFLKACEAIVFSSWASLFLCLPVLVAFGYLKSAPASYYPEMAGVLFMFLLFAGLTGTAVSILIAPAVRALSPRQMVLVGGAVLAVLAWLFLRSFRVWDMDGENNLLILDRFTAQLSAIHSPFFPGNWASSAVLAAAAGNHHEVLFQGSTLAANTLVFLPLLAWYGAKLYGRQWILCHNAAAASRKRRRRSVRLADGAQSDRANGGAEIGACASPPGGGVRTIDGAIDAAPAGRGPVEAPRPRPARGPGKPEESGGLRTSGDYRLTLRGPLLSLVLKDILIFARDPAQVSQSILFILLMVIYSLSLVRIPEYLTTGSLQLLVYFANLGAVCAILSSFTSRFLFPLISLEGKAFWIVGLAPVPRTYILQAKAFFGFAVSLILGLGTAVASNIALGMPPVLFAGALYTVVLAGVCLTALATGLGAAYPVFEEDNPARIAVGLGGTLNFFASALAVAILIGVEAAPHLVFGSSPGWWQAGACLLALAFTAALSFTCFRVGTAALTRREF